MTRHSISAFLLIFVLVGSAGCSGLGVKNILKKKSSVVEAGHQPIVNELIAILEKKPALKEALLASIHKADRLDVPTLEAYYKFLDDMVVLIPTERNLFPYLLEFYYLIDNAPNEALRNDPLFQQWTLQFAKDWGSFLDTPESAKGLKTFFDDPSYHIDDYFQGPSGWLTYNQFFGRQVRPGKRPVDGLCDDSIIVSASDSVFKGQWKIDENSEITAKGLKWNVHQLLDGSPYQDRFKGGTYMHMFLNVNDYHRFHVPVGGKILEIRKVPGKVILDVYKKEDGSLDVTDGDTYQFVQDRGLIILDSPIGLVAVLPIGMAQVSSVVLTPQKGDSLVKGESFGYLSFGGSDMVILFEAASKVNITAKPGIHYNQGKQIAVSLQE